MNVRRLSLLLLLLCAGAAGARSVTGLSMSFDASMRPVATVSLEAGETAVAVSRAIRLSPFPAGTVVVVR